MAWEYQERRISSFEPRGKPVMFSAVYDDGRIACFVVVSLSKNTAAAMRISLLSMSLGSGREPVSCQRA
jgi:hypothetical protein